MPSIITRAAAVANDCLFFNAATPASSVNTATVVFTATLEYNTTHSAAAKWRSQLTGDCCECELQVYIVHSAVSFPAKHVHRWICYIYIIREESPIFAPQRLRF